MPSDGLFLIPAVVGQLIPMLLCLTVFVEVTIVRRCIVTLVASILSLSVVDPLVFQTRQVRCPVKPAVRLKRAPLTRIILGLLHTPRYQPFL